MASPHNPMLDENGRVWMTEPVRPPGVANNPKMGRQHYRHGKQIAQRSWT